MRIVIADYAGHPFQVELSRCLAARGHAVLHLHAADIETPKGNLKRLPGDPASFEVEGIRTGRRFDKQQFLRRRFIESRIGALAAQRALAFRPEIVVGCNMPIDAQRKLVAACRRRGIPFVFWIQDIVSKAAYHFLGERLGLPGRAVGAYYMRLEAALLCASDAVIAISEKFIEPLAAWGVAGDKIRVIRNWAPLSEIHPVPKQNGWAREHGLADRLTALYTGTLGMKHDPSLLAELAEAGAAMEVSVAVASEGAGATWLDRHRRARRLDNLLLLPFQSMEVYPEVLGAGDLLLAMIGEEAAGFSVPSKILSYLAAGKPIVAAIAGDNDAARMIREADAGFVVEPGDRRGFIDGALTLASRPELRAALGRNARDFAVKNFAIAGIAGRFEEIFARLGREPRHAEEMGTLAVAK